MKAPKRSDRQGRTNRSGQATGQVESERLQKVLSRAGLASRREVEEWIRAGRLTVNSVAAVLGVRVASSDQIRLDGRLIRQVKAGAVARVFLIHRSPGESLRQPAEGAGLQPEGTGLQPGSTRLQQPVEGRDQSSFGEPTEPTAVLDRLPRRAGRRFIPVSPMPRIDGGLELVTSDGDLAARLQRAMRGLTSEFSVRVHGELSPQGVQAILEGVLDTGERLQIERCEPAGGEGTNHWYSLLVRGASGKDIRQLFERQGALVSRVLRISLGSLALGRVLARGKFRELSAAEVETLLTAVSR